MTIKKARFEVLEVDELTVRRLRVLERANLLVAVLAERPGWYRYHQLMREFLVAELDPAEADALRHAAFAWSRDRGLLEEGDIGEILGLVDISGDSPDTPINAQGAHGNSQLRAKYFQQGYDGGNPGVCTPPKRSDIRAGA